MSLFNEMSDYSLFLEMKTESEYKQRAILKKLDYDKKSGTVKMRDGKRCRLIFSKTQQTHALMNNLNHSPERAKKGGLLTFDPDEIPTIIINVKDLRIKNINEIMTIINHEYGHLFLHNATSNKSTKAIAGENFHLAELAAKKLFDDTAAKMIKGADDKGSKHKERILSQVNDGKKKVLDDISTYKRLQKYKYGSDTDAIRGALGRRKNIDKWSNLIPKHPGKFKSQEEEDKYRYDVAYPNINEFEADRFSELGSQGKCAKKVLRHLERLDRRDAKRKGERLGKKEADDYTRRRKALDMKDIDDEVYKHPEKYAKERSIFDMISDGTYFID